MFSLIPSFIVITPSKAAACSPTETIDGLYTVLTFSSTGTCTWTVPTGITSLDSLVVAGGGGGGSGTVTDAPNTGAGGGGGGGGQVVETTSRTVAATQVITIVVGSGGNGASAVGTSYPNATPPTYRSGNYGYPGGTSSISLASGWSTSTVGGGGSIIDSSKYNLVAWGAGRDRLGGSGGSISVAGYGGGSGSENIGSNPSSSQAGQGASDNSGVTPTASTSLVAGVTSSITGTAIVYANGGGGGSRTSAGSTGTTYGSGGGGGISSSSNEGTNGLSGVVIIRFLTYVAPSSSSDDSSTPVVTPTAINPCSGSHKVTIYFGGGESEIDKSDKKKINELASLINSCSFKKVVLSGFTSIDKPDSPSYALFRKSLSKKRANNVEEHLLSKLSKKNKKLDFKTYAKSNANPKKSNKSEKTRSANRRVEIVVS